MTKNKYPFVEWNKVNDEEYIAFHKGNNITISVAVLEGISCHIYMMDNKVDPYVYNDYKHYEIYNKTHYFETVETDYLKTHVINTLLEARDDFVNGGDSFLYVEYPIARNEAPFGENAARIYASHKSTRENHLLSVENYPSFDIKGEFSSAVDNIVNAKLINL
jgi:hypothetical protein